MQDKYVSLTPEFAATH